MLIVPRLPNTLYSASMRATPGSFAVVAAASAGGSSCFSTSASDFASSEASERRRCCSTTGSAAERSMTRCWSREEEEGGREGRGGAGGALGRSAGSGQEASMKLFCQITLAHLIARSRAKNRPVPRPTNQRPSPRGESARMLRKHAERVCSIRVTVAAMP